MTEQNKNEVAELEIKWRENFEKEFIKNPYAMKFDLAKKENGEYEQGAVQSKWLWFLAGCKAAQVEMLVSDEKLNEYVGKIYSLEEKLKDREQEIEKWKKCASDNEQFWQFKRTQLLGQLKERNELIKEFIRLMVNTSMYFGSEDAKRICDQARKMVGEE